MIELAALVVLAVVAFCVFAAAMAFLASDDAGYITGQVLRVNGGMSMGG